MDRPSKSELMVIPEKETRLTQRAAQAFTIFQRMYTKCLRLLWKFAEGISKISNDQKFVHEFYHFVRFTKALKMCGEA